MQKQQDQPRGQAWIKNRVMNQGLCTGCSACVGLCPYQDFYRDETVILHDCDRDYGRCQHYCPRSPTDTQALLDRFYDPSDLVDGLGACRAIYLARAADARVRRNAQHGGTVSALTALALEEGIIDTAVVSERDDLLRARAVAVTSPGQVALGAKTKFSLSPTVALFNRLSREPGKIGVVATPCQALALAKMRAMPFPGDEERVGRLKLVIGLFCGWALSWRRLKSLLQERVGEREIVGLDIPPSGHRCMEVHTGQGVVEIPMEAVEPCVRESCRYCYDLTCEFADLSVGSARSPEGWEVDRHWNQVIVRSEGGERLLEKARARGVLEFREVPGKNLDRLRHAAINKRRMAVANLGAKAGGEGDLVYFSESKT